MSIWMFEIANVAIVAWGVRMDSQNVLSSEDADIFLVHSKLQL